jgi:hypothetical protein
MQGGCSVRMLALFVCVRVCVSARLSLGRAPCRAPSSCSASSAHLEDLSGGDDGEADESAGESEA